MALGPLAVAPTRRAPVRSAAKALEVTQRRVAYERDVGAPTAIAAVRAAAGHVGLAAKGHRSVAAAPTFDEDPRAVIEHAAIL